MRAELTQRGIEPVLAAERWTQTSELAFYCDGKPNVYCLGGRLGDRDSQYDLWRPNPCADSRAFEGRTFILVGLDMDRLSGAFEAMEPTCTITYKEDGGADRGMDDRGSLRFSRILSSPALILAVCDLRDRCIIPGLDEFISSIPSTRRSPPQSSPPVLRPWPSR